MIMTGKVTPAIGYIGNALRSIAKDHITGFTEDTYDEHFQEYQAILNKLNAIQDEEGNLKKTPFKYIVNEEFIFAMVDENDVFLAGLQWDGTPKFAKMEENAGHEISSINAQIKYLHEEINQVRTDLAENIEIKDEEGAVVKTPFRYIQNEEFIFAKVDAEDKFLFGIEWDGTPKFGKTSAVEDRLQSQVTLISEKVATIMGDEDTTNIIDTMNELKKFFAEIKNTETLTDILANLDNVAKNLDKTTIKDEEGNVQDTPFRVISNEEFIKAIVDAENKVLFGFYRATGEPYYPLNEMYHVIQNEEYFAAWITTDDKVVLGLRRDGEIIGEIHAVNALKQVISELKEKLDTIYDNTKELLSVLSLQENQEYLTVEKDADDKVLSATYNDGSHYIHKAKSEPFQRSLSILKTLRAELRLQQMQIER